MKLFSNKLIGIVFCLILCLPQMTISITSSNNNKMYNNKNSRKSEKKKRKTNPPVITQPPVINESWLKQKFDGYNAKFEEHKKNHVWIYSMIMLIIGFVSNLPDAFIEKFPHFKSALKFLKSFATLFANIRSITAECMNGFEELRNVFKQDQDSELNEKDIQCEIEKASKKDKILDYNSASISEKKDITKSFYQPSNFDVKAENKKDPTCEELVELKKTAINPQTYPETDFSKQIRLGILFQDPKYVKEIKKLKYLATINTPKSLEELKQLYLDEPDIFFAHFDFQAEFNTQVLLDPENYPLSWKLVELRICPHKEKHFHLRALCFEAMLHKHNPTLMSKVKSEIDSSNEKASVKSATVKIILKKTKNKRKYSSFVGKSFLNINNMSKFLTVSKSVTFRIPKENLFTKLKEESDIIRKEFIGKPNWQLLNDLPDHDVIAFKKFGKANIKSGVFNLIWKGITGLFEYTKSIIRFLTFRSHNEKLYPNEKDYELPNTDIYTFGLSNKEIDTSDEIKKRLIEAYVIYFRIHNIVRSTAVSKVFDDYVNSDCKIFDKLPSFDLSEIDTEETDVNKLVKEKKGIFKVVGEFFAKIWDIIKIIFKLYFDCLNPFYDQFSSITEYTREYLKGEIEKDIPKNIDEYVDNVAKKETTYEERVELFLKGGFDKNSAKIMAFSTTLDFKFKELLKSPKIKDAVEKIKKEGEIFKPNFSNIDVGGKITKEEIQKIIENLKKQNQKINAQSNTNAELKEVLDKEEDIKKKKEKEMFVTINYNLNKINESVSELKDTDQFKDKNLELLSVGNNPDGTLNTESKVPVEQTADNTKSTTPTSQSDQLYQKDKTEPEKPLDKSPEKTRAEIIEQTKLSDVKMLGENQFSDPDSARMAFAAAYVNGEDYDIGISNCSNAIKAGAIGVYNSIEDSSKVMVKELPTLIPAVTDMSKEFYDTFKSDDSTTNKLGRIFETTYNYGPDVYKSSFAISDSFDSIIFSAPKGAANYLYDVHEKELISAAKSSEGSKLKKSVAKLIIGTKVLSDNSLVEDGKGLKKNLDRYKKYAYYTSPFDRLSRRLRKSPIPILGKAGGFLVGIPGYANKGYFLYKESKLASESLTKLGDDKNSERLRALVSFKEKSDNSYVSKNRFKELISNVIKDKTNSESESARKSTLSFDFNKEEEDKINELHNEIRTHEGLKGGLTTLYNTLFNLNAKYIIKTQERYEKLYNYYDIIDKISSIMSSLKENIFSNGFERIKTHITSFVKQKICAFLTYLAKQLLNFPVVSFMSAVWKLYKFFGIVRKIVNLLYSAIKSSMPDRMFYIGQFISELMNLGFAMFSEDTICKVADDEGSRRFKRLKTFKKRKN